MENAGLMHKSYFPQNSSGLIYVLISLGNKQEVGRSEYFTFLLDEGFMLLWRRIRECFWVIDYEMKWSIGIW